MKLSWPTTLLGRNIALLIAAVMVSQIAAVVIFLVFVQRPRVLDAASLLANQIVTIDRILGAVSPAERSDFVKRMDARTSLPPDTIDFRQDDPAHKPRGYEMRLFFAELAARVPPDIALRRQNEPVFRLWIQVHIADTPYWVALPADRAQRYNGMMIAIPLSLALAALATLAAYLIHRRINRPLQQLAAAADRLGRGGWPEPVPETGPREIAVVATTFNRMTKGLAEIEASRAAMLAGISHDIRTPLTKLRLAFAMPATLDSLDTPALSAERFIDDIDAIVQQFIDFARGGDGEVSTPGDMNALIEQLAADFAGLGHPFELALEALPPLSFRPVSMLRLIMNLMQNATLYGRVGLSVRSWRDGDFAYVAVEDRGPGIAEHLLPLIKQPFRRGPDADPQRSGSGLGLAIANRIAIQHEGSLELTRRKRGGLAATIRLPLTL